MDTGHHLSSDHLSICKHSFSVLGGLLVLEMREPFPVVKGATGYSSRLPPALNWITKVRF